MHYSDLFVVLVLVAGLYGLLVALARQRRFLTGAVNPNRAAWLIAGLTALWFGLGMLRLEAASWNWRDNLVVLLALVTDTPLSTRGKVATVSLLLGAILIVLVVWCRFNLPKDPSTFRQPYHRGRALRYYVNGLRDGLDYAVLMRPSGERLEEAWDHRHIRLSLPHLPRVSSNGEMATRTLEEQVEYWRQTATRVHGSMLNLDAAISPAHQGGNRRMVFDAEYGAMYFAYLRPPASSAADPDPLFLFAAALSQEAVNLKVADAHFDLLLKALKQIDTNVRVA
jgi:hypothetical protein